MAYKCYVTGQQVGGVGQIVTSVSVFYVDTTNNVVVDSNSPVMFYGTDITAYTLVELMTIAETQILTESVAQGYGMTAADIIWGVPFGKTFNSPTRSLNSAFQISIAHNATVSYSIDIAATLSLTTGQVGTVILEYADNSGISTNVVEIGRFVNGNAGSLAIGLNLTQTQTANINGIIPAGKYVRIRTVNTTGTPTFTYRSGQEVLE